MQRVLTSELAGHIGRRVRMAGWLHHQRRLSRVTFLVLRDGGGLAQVVVDEPALRSTLG
jgi:nondiscriminating aspartyl-tRNA synthetase